MFARMKGFTLIELLITLSVLAILLLVAVPSFGGFVAQPRVDAAKNKLISSIALARSEAITRGAQVVICRRNPNADTCAGTTVSGDSDWSDGWLIYIDENADLAIDTDGLPRVSADINDASTIQFSMGDLVLYVSMGSLITASASDEVFSIEDRADTTIGVGLSVMSIGV